MDTIKHHKARPIQNNIDLSEARLRHVTEGYDKMKSDLQANDHKIMARPEEDGLWFYVQQHAMGLIERAYDDDEPLGEAQAFVDRYHSTIRLKTLRMFYYLMLICTRESRHMGTGKHKLFDKFPAIRQYHNDYIQDQSEDAAVSNMLANAPDVSLGEYTEFLYRAFTIPNYQGGYGGPAWAKVAKPLRDFVHGKISAEILMDTAFTLAHNNGPIFNKGMLFMNHTKAKLNKILDVQRSGQIPQLIAHHYSEFDTYINADLQEYVEDFTKLDSGFGGRVDWTQVKNISGTACYTKEISAQNQSKNTWTNKLKQMKAAAAEKLAAAKSKAAKIALLKGSIEILPGVLVAKGKRSQS